MSEPFIAEIKMFAGNFAPRGWAFCEGQLLAISQNTALFSLLGTNYGGDGRTTFGLPDLRGRVPMHPGSGPGLSPRALGEGGGAERVALAVAEMPAHGHGSSAEVRCAGSAGTADSPVGNVPAGSSEGDQIYAENPTETMGTAVNVSVASTGGDQPHSTMPPFRCVNFIIALQGIFPSRS